MKKIKLTQGKFAIVDDENFDKVSEFNWYYSETKKDMGYAKSYSRGNKFYLHRLIMGNPKGKQVDHINGDKLNCSKDNLRIATNQINSFNRKKTNHKTSSIYKGVFYLDQQKYHKPRKIKKNYKYKVWVSILKFNGKKHYLGSFSIEKEAAIAYNEAAKKFFGKFALLNVV